MPDFNFTLKTTDGAARRGRLQTAWGDVETPVFMPVGTAATVKGMMPESVRATGASIILANTYHLMLRPGAERVGRRGGRVGPAWRSWRPLGPGLGSSWRPQSDPKSTKYRSKNRSEL